MAQAMTRRGKRPRAVVPDDHPLLEGIAQKREEATKGLSPTAQADMERTEAALSATILHAIEEERELCRVIAIYERILDNPQDPKYPKTPAEMKARTAKLDAMKKQAFNRVFPAFNKAIQKDIPDQEAMREALWISGMKKPEWTCACGAFVAACNMIECPSCWNKRQNGEAA